MYNQFFTIKPRISEKKRRKQSCTSIKNQYKKIYTLCTTSKSIFIYNNLYITIFRTTYNLQILRDVQMMIMIVTHLVFISILLYYYVTVYTGYLENNDKFFAYEQNGLN